MIPFGGCLRHEMHGNHGRFIGGVRSHGLWKKGLVTVAVRNHCVHWGTPHLLRPLEASKSNNTMPFWLWQADSVLLGYDPSHSIPDVLADHNAAHFPHRGLIDPGEVLFFLQISSFALSSGISRFLQTRPARQGEPRSFQRDTTLPARENIVCNHPSVRGGLPGIELCASGKIVLACAIDSNKVVSSMVSLLSHWLRKESESVGEAFVGMAFVKIISVLTIS